MVPTLNKFQTTRNNFNFSAAVTQFLRMYKVQLHHYVSFKEFSKLQRQPSEIFLRPKHDRPRGRKNSLNLAKKKSIFKLFVSKEPLTPLLPPRFQRTQGLGISKKQKNLLILILLHFLFRFIRKSLHDDIHQIFNRKFLHCKEFFMWKKVYIVPHNRIISVQKFQEMLSMYLDLHSQTRFLRN